MCHDQILPSPCHVQIKRKYATAVITHGSSVRQFVHLHRESELANMATKAVVWDPAKLEDLYNTLRARQNKARNPSGWCHVKVLLNKDDNGIAKAVVLKVGTMSTSSSGLTKKVKRKRFTSF